MKSATTSLHQILGAHPDVFLPDHETHFYDIDDFEQHQDFFFYGGGKWHFPDFDANTERYLDWYSSFFSDAADGQMLGEDSTGYLSSPVASERIARLNPDAKILVMLRDPGSRSYSQYWHLVRSGRAFRSFEDCLRVDEAKIINRSLYRRQIEQLLRHIPASQLRFVLFEDFVRDPEPVVREVCEFLGLSFERLPAAELRYVSNPAMLPRYIGLQLCRNQVMRMNALKVYAGYWPGAPTPEPKRSLVGLADRIHSRINPLEMRKAPPMRPETRAFLDEYFARENRGISELIQREVDGVWYQSRRQGSRTTADK